MDVMLRLMFFLMFLATNSLLFKPHGRNIYVNAVSNDVTTKNCLSMEYDKMLKEGTLKNYFKHASRVNQISDFICACGVMRKTYIIHYQMAKFHCDHSFRFVVEPCRKVWKFYVNGSKRAFCLNKLRGFADYPEYPTILQPSEYGDFAHAACKLYKACSHHIRNSPRTIRVIEKLQNGTLLTITQMLRREKRKFLFTTAEMKHINNFMIASELGPFPFLKFVRNGTEYAVPQLRNSTDRLMCPIRGKKRRKKLMNKAKTAMRV